MIVASFMTRKLTKEFIKKNGRIPTKNEFIAIQYEAINSFLRNNSVYGINENGGNKMAGIVSKKENLERELSGKKSNFLPGGIRDRNNLKNMTKEMYEDFVKQGKKFVNLLTGQKFDSLEESGIDIDGDTIIVDGQKYLVNMFAWRK